MKLFRKIFNNYTWAAQKAILIAILIGYGIFVFVNLSFNPLEWGVWSRFIFFFYTVFVVIKILKI